ncbi:hypothetical protein PRBRB14_14170 [Hallella multisaccharivorax DSM 17128]|uniref:DUF1015 domain-containing protein n=1 Tax=Hallella multisaccharivorax DSM 17128 TaxID=688246 RepID=F8NC29_9BACT|nr:DUF1015 domain-containing protein [Hallella multisaccharivorax]EGN56996.1 hypothetical protein UCP033563 [Hallella multisaccharivorax DSM 17128]GJG30538.1 hypothetical protein PRBRB14_14170 [Hallella multisaccharivorax DSM 17128]
MATVKPFRGIRPPKEFVEKVESYPYDVLSSEEARQAAGDNEMSFYHINMPEINFPEGVASDDPRVYDVAKREFDKFLSKGWLKQDSKENYYLYAQSLSPEKTQFGIVVAAYADDYHKGIIKRHELTRREKEDDRMRHVLATDANVGPAFFAYPDNEVLNDIISRYARTAPEYDFVASEDGFRHRFWVISDKKDIDTITNEFAKMPSLYIADGHHRSAAAVRVADEKAKADPNHTGKEEYNYFMAVCFPASELTILDYNRVVKDLNGLTHDEFLNELEKDFVVLLMGSEEYRPSHRHEFSLYLDGNWYSLTARPGTYDDNDPIGCLDVDISSRLILDKLMGIKDLRSDKRVDFVGGLRGLKELRRRVDDGEMRWALALYPVSMDQIMRIADCGKIMPPKATWFEPKLRSGLVIHKLS